MRVHIGTDHAGFELKNNLVEYLKGEGFDVVDHGAHVYDEVDDYPKFCVEAAEGVVADQKAGVDALGIVLGGSGNGEQIAANKVKGARAALIWNEPTALLARQHNNANLAAVGFRQHTLEEATHLIDLFLAEPFSDEERHIRRIAQIADYENGVTL
jgi:ribose 5-phosphate isomerase B